MKNRVRGWCCYVIAICAILIFLVTSIDMHGFHRSFYESEYTEMNTATSLHMSQDDLMKATNTLLDYLQDERDDIKVQIAERGMEKDAFNERESLHMVDVKNLYQNALTARFIAIVILVLALAYVGFQKRLEAIELLAKGYIQIAGIFVCLVVFLGLWAAVDFTSLWEGFHRLFFTNDLWLLNPRIDLMINMFPETFFFHMVIRIAITFLLCFGIPLILSLYYINKKYAYVRIFKRKEAIR